MSKSRAVAVIVLLALFAALTWWMLDGSGPEVPAGGTSTTAAAPVEGKPVQGVTGKADEVAGEGNRRQAVEVEAAPVAQGSGKALVGKVVDEAGTPVPGARIACTPGFGGDGANFDMANFDPETDFDPARWTERLQERNKEKVDAVSDAAGVFRLVPVGKGARLDLQIRARGHAVLDQNVQRPGAADVDLGSLTVKRSGIASGRVVDRGGKAVAGARVTRAMGGMGFMQGLEDMEIPGMEMADAVPGMGESVSTDAEGRFELQHVPAGELALRARHPDHPVAKLDGLTVAAGQTLTDLLITAEPGAMVSGRVIGVPENVKGVRVVASQKREGTQQPGDNSFSALLGDAGELLGDAGMQMGERSVAVGADGSFVLRGLAADRQYRIQAVQRGRGFTGNTPCSQRLEVSGGAQGIELRYEAGISVTFQVIDAKTSAPVERMWVNDQLKGGSMMDFMGAFAGGMGRNRHYPDGRVTIANLRPKAKQTLSLKVEALGHANFEKEEIALPTAGELDLGIVRLEPLPVVKVTVTNAADGAFVAGARVSLRSGTENSRMAEFMPQLGGGGPRSATTGADGTCTLNSQPGSEVTLAVDSQKHAPWSSGKIKLPERGDFVQRVQLVAGGSVQVTVAAANGTASAGVQVEHRTPEGRTDRRGTDAAGQVVFERLAPGTHGFRPGGRSGGRGDMMAAWREMAPGGARNEGSWEDVEVTDGNRSVVQLKPKAASTLTGLVRENGLPLAGARVAFQEGVGEGAEEAIATEVMGAWGDMAGAGGGGGGRSARTDAEGRYRLKDLPPGEHRLRVTHKDRSMPATAKVSLREGDNTLDFDLDVTVVRGIVRDPEGKPVAGASVEAIVPRAGDASPEAAAIEGAMAAFAPMAGNRTKAKTDAEGRFELRGLQGGTRLVVRATAKGFAPASSAPLELQRGGAMDNVVLQLVAGGSVKVQAANTGPFAGVQATYAGNDAPGLAPVVAFMRNGSATLEGLRPGTWTITLNAMGEGGEQKRTVEVVAGRTADVTF